MPCAGGPPSLSPAAQIPLVLRGLYAAYPPPGPGVEELVKVLLAEPGRS